MTMLSEKTALAIIAALPPREKASDEAFYEEFKSALYNGEQQFLMHAKVGWDARGGYELERLRM